MEPALTRATLTNRDRLVNASRPRVAALCVRAFAAIQDHPNKEEQLLALAGCFILMASVMKVSAQEAFIAIKNLMTDKDGPDGLVPQFAAMQYHVETELLA